MMPIHPSTYVAYALAVVTGFLFGFVLHRAGFGSATKLAAQFYLKDMTVLKVMFTAIVTALLGLTILRGVGLVDFDAIYVNPTSLAPQIVGGVVFGIGFVVGGYCPGTGIVAAAIGKIDGIVFVLGAAFGAIVYAGIYPAIAPLATMGDGKRELLPDLLGLSYGTVALLVTLMAIGMFVGAEALERYLGRPRPTPTAKAEGPEETPAADPHPAH